MTATGWRDERHKEILESTLRGLERRRQADPTFSLADAEGSLAHLYIQDGNDQGGRGELQDIFIAATIAAHERFIADWKARGADSDAGAAATKEWRMPIEIKRVETLRELKSFIRFPLKLYAGDPRYVPVLDLDDLGTLRKDRNPAFEYCEADYWLALKDGKTVGRIAAILNRRYVEKWGNKYVRFGWIDFIEDFEVASALLGAVEDWARSRGMEGIHGPMGFTDLDREGMLVEGFDEVATLATIYNHPYYPEYLGRLGYAKDVDWIEFQVRTPKEIPDKVIRVNELIAKRSGVRIFEWKSKKQLVSRFGEQLFEIIDEAYAHLYGTVPLTRRQVRNYINTYLGFVDPRFTKIMVDTEDRLVGFGISVPTLSRALQKARGRLFPLGWLHLLLALRHPKHLDLYLTAVKPEYQTRGVIAILMAALNQTAIEEGVEFSESNPELETNIQVHGLWKEYEKRQHKRRRVFLKKLA